MPAAEKAPKAQSGAQPGSFAEPFRDYNFKLLFIPDVPEGHFTQCSNIGVKVDAISYREGGNNQVVHRLPGHVEYASVTPALWSHPVPRSVGLDAEGGDGCG